MEIWKGLLSQGRVIMEHLSFRKMSHDLPIGKQQNLLTNVGQLLLYILPLLYLLINNYFHPLYCTIHNV